MLAETAPCFIALKVHVGISTAVVTIPINFPASITTNNLSKRTVSFITMSFFKKLFGGGNDQAAPSPSGSSVPAGEIVDKVNILATKVETCNN